VRGGSELGKERQLDDTLLIIGGGVFGCDSEISGLIWSL
jgi:hypothetical protein